MCARLHDSQNKLNMCTVPQCYILTDTVITLVSCMYGKGFGEKKFGGQLPHWTLRGDVLLLNTPWQVKNTN